MNRRPAPAAGRPFGHVIGHIDDESQQRAAERLTQVVAAQRARPATSQRIAQYELEGKDIGRLEALDRATHELSEVCPHPFDGDLRDDDVVRGAIVGEQCEVADVTLVARPDTDEITKREANHAVMLTRGRA
jgi:hypothetical protein